MEREKNLFWWVIEKEIDVVLVGRSEIIEILGKVVGI